MALAALSLAACGEAPPWLAADWRPEQPPQRIVLGSVLAAESLLGVVPSERIAGVHAFAAEPAWSRVASEAARLPLLGAGPEQLLSVHPDLVIVDAYTRPETLALLSAGGVPVVRAGDAHDFDEIAFELERLGRIVHRRAAAAARVDMMRQRLAEVRARARSRTGPAWRLLCLDGALHTHGAGSLFDAVVRAAAARNVASEHGVGMFRKLDVEELLAWRPDALVVAGDPDAPLPAWIPQYPGLGLLECVRRERVLVVPSSLLGTTSHHLVEAVTCVAAQLDAWGRP